MKMSTAHFDKSYWPSTGTSVPTLPADLNDLWETCEEQATVFVAEALLGDPPRIGIDLTGDGAVIEVFAWDVGGDTISFREPLVDVITSDIDLFGPIRGDAQAAELEQFIANLSKVVEAAERGKKQAHKMLDEYRAQGDDGSTA